jgi:hypothetical protein
VVLKLNHIKFELVPAYKGSWFDSSYHIPGPSSGFSNWITTDPNGFNDQLTRANQAYDNKIKPMIRLVKYWNALNGYVYETFPLEKDLAAYTHWFCYTVKDYFFSAMNSLSTWDLPSYKKDKVARAKEIIQNTKNQEANNLPITPKQK